MLESVETNIGTYIGMCLARETHIITVQPWTYIIILQTARITNISKVFLQHRNNENSTQEYRLSIVGGRRPPQFYLPSYRAEIFENHTIGANVIQVKAKAFSEGAEVGYALKSEGAAGAGAFEVDPTSGTVRLTRQLDYEDPRQPRQYSLVVTATDGGDAFNTDVELTIDILDTNDNAPRFEYPDYHAFSVAEDVAVGTQLLRVAASDADSDTNITYSIEHAQQFRVDEEGRIYTRERLDADRNSGKYTFIVVASDQDKTAITTVHVFTTKTNDEPPRFSQQVYTPTIDEDAEPGARVVALEADDRDGDRVRFAFADGSTVQQQFSLDPETGEIRLRDGGNATLDRYKYELNVTATDDGSCCEGGASSVHTSTAVVVVFVADVNNNKPVFAQCDEYRPTMQRSAPVGSFVVKVTATDADNGLNGLLDYSLVRTPGTGGQPAFDVDEDSGKILTNVRLDGADVPAGRRWLPVTVRARDGGAPALDGYCTFIVEILEDGDGAAAPDAADEDALLYQPQFERALYEVMVTEEDNRDLPKPILTVSAKAEGMSRNFTYFLSSQALDGRAPRNSTFFVDPASGDIFITKPLDRDAPRGRRQYRFSVLAQDAADPHAPIAAAEVKVRLKDVNDNAPVFPLGIYYARLPETADDGTFVARITPIDVDDPAESSNARVSFNIDKNVFSEESGRSVFRIDPETGTIRTNACCLDRERTPDYAILVSATDGGGLKGTATVSILVTDVNDSPPRFRNARHEIQIDETDDFSLPTKALLDVTVLDDDEANQFVYKIVEDSRFGFDKFMMVSNVDGTGSLKAVRPLDADDDGNKDGFSFRIQVSDNGDPDSEDPDRIAFATVHVRLRDINDHAAVFSETNAEVVVSEDAAVGWSTLATFHASDPDRGRNGNLTYRVRRESDPRRVLAIGADGAVVTQVLDAERIMCWLHHPPHRVTSLLRTKPEDLMCTYERHCFALCHCCNYAACDCEMKCPDGCTCYRDHTWNNNIVDCSRRGDVTISREIPMDATVVFADGNNIRSLDSHTFIGRKRIRHLHLNNSNVQEIQNRSLSSLSALHVLRLENNNITELHNYEFQGLVSLRELYLHNNRLRSLSPDTFSPLRSLKVLTLSGNQLTSWPAWQLAASPYLELLTLADNPWSCACDHRAPMVEFLRHSGPKVDDAAAVVCRPVNGEAVDCRADPATAACDASLAPLLVTLLLVATLLCTAALTAYLGLKRRYFFSSRRGDSASRRGHMSRVACVTRQREKTVILRPKHDFMGMLPHSVSEPSLMFYRDTWLPQTMLPGISPTPTCSAGGSDDLFLHFRSDSDSPPVSGAAPLHHVSRTEHTGKWIEQYQCPPGSAADSHIYSVPDVEPQMRCHPPHPGFCTSA